MMNKMRQIENYINGVCENFNSSNLNIKLKVLHDPKQIHSVYTTYDGIKEFLYIAPQNEIEESIDEGDIFLGAFCDGKLGGVAKLSQLQTPSPFFYPPKSMSINGTYFGLSGLYVGKNYRGMRLASILFDALTTTAELCQADGIYADFDYRNIASMNLISRRYNMLGFTDGRQGSPDEATIYTTFFKDFTKSGKRVEALNINLSNNDPNYARSVIEKVMACIGSASIHCVDYCGGFNEIVCFDEPYIFKTTNIKHAHDITKEISIEK